MQHPKFDNPQLEPESIIRRPFDFSGQSPEQIDNTLRQGVQRWHQRAMPHFALSSSNTFAYIQCLRWLFGLPFRAQDPHTRQAIPGDPTRGILICGATGTGKTVLLETLLAIARHNAASWSFAGVEYFMSFPSVLATRITDEYSSGMDTLQRYKEIPLLAINDLGAEPREVLYMGNRQPLLANILEHRGDREGKFLLVTTNLGFVPTERAGAATPPAGTLLERYGDRAYSRIIRMCNVFFLGGHDMRTN